MPQKNVEKLETFTSDLEWQLFIQELFITEWKNCKRLLQEKRKFINRVFQNAEEDRSQGRDKNFFRMIKSNTINLILCVNY